MTLLDTPVTGLVAVPDQPGGAESPPRVKRWTKTEFYRLAERGAFDRLRVFLHRGTLIEVPLTGPRHATGIQRITVWLVRTFDPAYAVRIQIPFETPAETISLPDGAAVSLADNARQPHPNRASLVIEVADTSVELDREKAFDYAAAGVPDYWLINVREGELDVYRDPVPDPASATGWRYADHRVYRLGDSIAPLARPEAAIAVATLIGVPA